MVSSAFVCTFATVRAAAAPQRLRLGGARAQALRMRAQRGPRVLVRASAEDRVQTVGHPAAGCPESETGMCSTESIDDYDAEKEAQSAQKGSPKAAAAGCPDSETGVCDLDPDSLE